jgi:hypothetical protein
MKIKAEQATVLVITVMTLICATSPYITSRNANAGMQKPPAGTKRGIAY